MQAKARSVTERARREQIVAAAIEVLARDGHAATTFTRIARHAGLSSTGVISYHFADKQELQGEVLAATARTAGEHMGPRIAAANGARERLRARIESNVELLTVCPAHLRALREVLAATAASERPQVDGDPAGLASRVSTLEDGLRRGQRDGDFGAFDPAVMALAITGAIDAVVAVPVADPDAVRDRARELADAFARATAPALVGDPR
jgi:AcrR family transcriptional regulator